MDFIKIILCSVLSVGAIFVITKLMGHKQVAQLDFFDYVSGITIGSIAAELATNLRAPWEELTALVIYGAVSMLLSLLTRKLPRSRKIINGTPTVLISGGKINRDNMRRAKLDLDELLLLCRERGYFDLSEIETAVFEHNGRLSVLPTSASRPPSAESLGLSPTPASLGREIIMDGRLIDGALRSVGRDEAWLLRRMKEAGYASAEEIFLAVYHATEDKLLLYKK